MSNPVTLTPIYRKLIADLDTPVSVYLKLQRPNSFLLESVIGGEQVARYSFIGLDPFLTMLTTEGETTIIEGQKKTNLPLGAIDGLESIVSRYHMEKHPDLPPFIGGAVGFFSWEVIHDIESIQRFEKPGSPFPIAQFLFPQSIVVFDHAKRELILVTLVQENLLSDAEKRLDALEESLKKSLPTSAILTPTEITEDPFAYVESNYDEATFKAQIAQVKKHIYEGDVFQLVLSQKFKIKSNKNPMDIYRKLRSINPSPYMYFFDFGDYHIIGSSPEILVRLEEGIATVRPIAGTRPRIHGQEEALITELKQDPKECAEHLMLVDLGRNDLGRVCEFNSIQTTDLMSIEAYSHVLHMVSSIQGTLRPDKNAFDLFKATFPAGTLSGAPKIRAMQIIENLEPEQRGLYGGALGYIDFRGNMDLCIIIRTILAKNNTLYIQAGAGLVADSDPDLEYEESRNKAKGVLQACL